MCQIKITKKVKLRFGKHNKKGKKVKDIEKDEGRDTYVLPATAPASNEFEGETAPSAYNAQQGKGGSSAPRSSSRTR